jgi:hypothetical protein
MERNVFPLSSMSALGSFLSVQIQMLTLLTESFMAGILGCVAMNVSSPYKTVLVEILQADCAPGFSWWDGPSSVGKISKVVLQGGGSPFCPQGKSGS